jgi:hypothetical protein
MLQEFGSLSSAHSNILGMVCYLVKLAKVTTIRFGSLWVVCGLFQDQTTPSVKQVVVVSDTNRLNTAQVCCDSSREALDGNNSRDGEIFKVFVGKLKVGRDQQRPIAAAAGVRARPDGSRSEAVPHQG